MQMTKKAVSRRTILKTAPWLSLAALPLSGCGVVNTLNPVSYTHLTLPTIYSV